ncbi:MAG TPA: TonB-dependent receptor [Ferruginibacter sp.]|nr:TonB-dependent receptor [Ferruginibacter sp.]
MRPLIIIGIFFFSIASSFAQKGKIEGKITDAKTSSPLAGVSVLLKETGKGIATDLDGRFVLLAETGKKYTLIISSTNYEGKEINEVETGADGIAHIDVALDLKSKTGEGVVVRSTSARKESVNALITFQKNTNTVASVISAEAIRRSPDRNTGEVLKRLPGTSIQEGKFLVVRGLADRYNQAMLNGILLTSTEPDRKTFSFDILPSNMVDNIVVNKAFVPEYPGEWAGGLIQVNTKDIPVKNFFNVQLSSGFNTQTIGKDFYKDKAGKTDWLGIDDGTRDLPAGYSTKSRFDTLSSAGKTALGKTMRNAWSPSKTAAPLNVGFEINGGFSKKIFGKTLGAILGITYRKNNSRQEIINRHNNFETPRIFKGADINFNDTRYLQNTTLGALASVSLQLNNLNKISLKSIISVNTANSTISRNGIDDTRTEDISAAEFSFKQNTFFTTQLTGQHGLLKNLKLNWNGAFTILDGYNPDQRRLQYSKDKGSTNPYRAILSNNTSQASGSRIYQMLNDYIYSAGGDLTYTKNKHTIKGGYMLQVRDRLFDANLFANYLPVDNDALKLLPADQIFAPGNFGNGTDNKIAFDAIKGSTFRYLANTILNAGYIQFDNELFNNLRLVWGLRVEHFDQLVGSVKKWDPRHTYLKVIDYLPGLNATYKLNPKTNIRFSASQTVIRPELRELTALNLYDFELNASVTGNPSLKRTKITNLDLRYEFYSKPGEVFSAGVFYKHFNDPIEQIFNEGSGGASTFNFQNADKAYSTGIEGEFRKNLEFITAKLKNLTFQSNVAIIKSKVTDTALKIDRTLQGQSNYVVNLGMLYDLPKYGLNATLLFNVIGERIFLVGDKAQGSSSPDVYEAPRPLLDLQLAKKILKGKSEIKMNVSDILNRKQYFYQNANNSDAFQKNTDAYRFTRRFGTTFNFSINYSL